MKTRDRATFAFEPDFRHRLNQLAHELMHQSGVAGEAGRKGKMPGQVEFKDHRSYVSGDDLRFLDWNVFLRFGALAVKTFTQDEAPEALVILDRSASMGPPGSRQDALAREIAATLGFLALRAGGEAVLQCAGGAARDEARPLRGARSIEAWLSEVALAPEPEGPNRLDSFERLAAPPHAGRVTAWISDFLIEPLPAAAFAALARGGAQRLAFIVCAHADALEPVPAGDALTLGDAEGGRSVVARRDGAWRAAFQEARAEHVAAVTRLATRHQFKTIAASAEARFEDCITHALRVPG